MNANHTSHAAQFRGPKATFSFISQREKSNGQLISNNSNTEYSRSYQPYISFTAGQGTAIPITEVIYASKNTDTAYKQLIGPEGKNYHIPFRPTLTSNPPLEKIPSTDRSSDLFRFDGNSVDSSQQRLQLYFKPLQATQISKQKPSQSVQSRVNNSIVLDQIPFCSKDRFNRTCKWNSTIAYNIETEDDKQTKLMFC